MAKRLKAKLSVSSINKMIEEVNRYKQSIEDRNDLFVQRLADHGLLATKVVVGTIPSQYKVGGIDVDLEIQESGLLSSAVVRMSGEQAIFIEFGAGVTFNTAIGGTLHPPTKTGIENEFTIGSYPNQTHADSPEGWWYTDEQGTHHSWGVPTYAPLYEGKLEIEQVILKIAKEVFANG